jgi:putative oxidoreductase
MMDLASLVLRIGLGVMFIAHGLQLAFGKFGGPGVTGFSEMLSGMGFTPALFWSYTAAYTTLVGGIFLISGIFVRGASFLLLIFITVAAVKVHLAKGFFLGKGGYEYNFIIACVCIALIIMGAGKYSLMNKF